MQYSYYTTDVFTNQIFAGNPLAVFPDARGLSSEQMQAITKEFNLSETAFVLPPETQSGGVRLRIFTPARELPFAGHPTIGTAFVLAATGRIELQGVETHIVFEEGAGPVDVKIRTENNKPVFTQLSAPRMPEYGPPPPPAAELAEILSLEPGEVLDGPYGPQAVSCGVPFLFVPLASLDALRRARVVHSRWEASLAPYWAQEMYLFTRDVDETSGVDFRARLFAPGMGITEDPATGAAATAIAGYLALRDHSGAGQLRWRILQGVEIGRPSYLEVEADRAAGELTAIRVGGQSVLVSEGRMEVPD